MLQTLLSCKKHDSNGVVHESRSRIITRVEDGESELLSTEMKINEIKIV